MATGPGFPSSTSVFVPTLGNTNTSTGALIVGYSRNPRSFALPAYVQYRRGEFAVGYYAKFSPQEAYRWLGTPAAKVWADGQPRPMHAEGKEQFNLVQYRMQRYDYGVTIGDLERGQAFYDTMAFHTGTYATQLMTYRSNRIITLATTTANWTVAGLTDPDLSADHTSTATALGGGLLDAGSSTSPFLRKALDAAEVLINKDTGGMVTRQDLLLVLSPDAARKISESAEVHDYLKGSYHTKEELTLTMGPNPKFGLPQSIYGFPIVVEDAVNVTSLPGQTLAKSYAFPTQTALIVSRKGGLQGPVPESPSFSTLNLIYYRDFEMQSLIEHHPRDMYSTINIMEMTAEVLASPLSGYLITSATS